MRENGNGRGEVPNGGDPFAYGDVVTMVAAPCHRGKVVSVGSGTVSVRWPDVDFPVVYATYLIRKLWPWES